MKLLFITKYMNGDFLAIQKELNVILVVYAAVFAAMTLDFIFGLRAAWRRGDASTSYGFRRSTLKIIEYYACMFIASIVDVISSISESVNMPYATFLMALILVGIEGFSIWENFQNKKLRSIDKKDVKTILSLIENRDDIVNAMINVAKKQLDKEKEEKDNE